MPRFFRLRRVRCLTAAAANVLLLQLVFASGAGACPVGAGMGAMGADGAAAMTMTMTMTDAGAAHASHEVADAAPSERDASDAPASHHHDGGHCEMACTPASCGSAGHCSTSAATDDHAPSASSTANAAQPRGVRTEAPRSVSIAPEPPPPRA